MARNFKDTPLDGKILQSLGSKKSIFSGTGLQFKDLRSYEYGDDSKHIHWNSFAKTNKLYIKTYEEERHIKIKVILDCSNTMLWGLNGTSKLMAACEIVYLLYFICDLNQDYLEVEIWDKNVYKLQGFNGLIGIRNFSNYMKSINRMNDNGEINLLPKKYEDDPIKNRDIRNIFPFDNPLIVLSDFIHFLPLGPMNILMNRVKTICLRLISPLDLETRKPYAFSGYSYMHKYNQKFYFAAKSGNKEIIQIKEEDYKKWGVQTINIKDNYLLKSSIILRNAQ